MIAHNVFNDNFTGNYPVVTVADGQAVLIQGNTFNLYSQPAPGAIQVSNRAVATRVLDNVFKGMATSQHYKQGLMNDTVVRDDNLQFADIQTWGNGSQVYCSNCKAGAILAGGGSGAWGRMINGVWNGN